MGIILYAEIRSKGGKNYMKWINEDNLTDFEQDEVTDISRLRTAIMLMKIKIVELEEEIEDTRLEMIEEESRRS